jgi:hypothetical protein
MNTTTATPKSWINAGDHARAVDAALTALQVPNFTVNFQNGIVSVPVPEGVNPDEHQDALTSIVNAIAGHA